MLGPDSAEFADFWAKYSVEFGLSNTKAVFDLLYPDIPARQTQKDFVIWRYMKLKDFKELINDSLFHFSNPNHFEDKREFGVPKQWLEKDFWKPIIKEKNKDFIKDVNIDDLVENFIFSLTDFYYSKDRFGVSCWYSAKSESELMWRANKNADKNADKDAVVVVKSSAQRLFAAFDEKVRSHNLLLGRINYVNYNNFRQSDLTKSKLFYCRYDGFFLRNLDNGFVNPIFYKRDLFKDERECRAVIEIKDGKRKLPINLDILIDEVVIHPDFYNRGDSEHLFASLRDKKIKFRKSEIHDSEPIKAKRNLFKKREAFALRVQKENSFWLEFDDINHFNKWSRIVNKKMGIPNFAVNAFGIAFLSSGTSKWCNPEDNKFNKKILALGTESLIFTKNQKVFLSREDAKKEGYFYHEDEMELAMEPYLIKWGLKK